MADTRSMPGRRVVLGSRGPGCRNLVDALLGGLSCPFRPLPGSLSCPFRPLLAASAAHLPRTLAPNRPWRLPSRAPRRGPSGSPRDSVRTGTPLPALGPRDHRSHHRDDGHRQAAAVLLGLLHVRGEIAFQRAETFSPSSPIEGASPRCPSAASARASAPAYRRWPFAPRRTAAADLQQQEPTAAPIPAALAGLAGCASGYRPRHGRTLAASRLRFEVGASR